MKTVRLLLTLLPESTGYPSVWKGSGWLVLSGIVLSWAGKNTPWVWQLSVSDMLLMVVCIATTIWLMIQWKAYPYKKSSDSILTRREREIAVLLLTDSSNKEIADHLCIGANTLKTHIRNIYKKTESDSRESFRINFSARES